jgi:integrase
MRKRRGRGEGGIREVTLKNGTKIWRAEIRLPSGKRKSVYATTKGEALKKMDKLRHDLAIGITGEALELTVADWLNRWLDQVKPTVEPQTYNPYAQHCRTHLIPHVGHVTLAKFKAAHVHQLYTDLSKASVSPALQRKVATTLTIALNAAMRQDIITSNPAAKVAKPKAAKADMTPLDKDQALAFLNAAFADRLYPFYRTALDSGARPGELFALMWDDVLFDQESLSITKTLEDLAGHLRIKETKTARSRRRVTLSPQTLTVLAKHKEAMVQAGLLNKPVFCDTEGGHLRITNVAKRSFKPLLKSAGLPEIRLYDLRHTCATLLLLADVSPKVVSERLGHASVTITLDTYSHVLPTMQQNAAKALGEMLSPENGATMALLRRVPGQRDDVSP